MVGQHIRILKGGRWVHAVDCGDETVLHLVEEAPPPRVRRAYRPEFVAGAQAVEVVTHRERTFPAKEIVKRAYSRASDPALAAMFQDSESFVEWCTTGRLTAARNTALEVPGVAPAPAPARPAPGPNGKPSGAAKPPANRAAAKVKAAARKPAARKPAAKKVPPKKVPPKKVPPRKVAAKKPAPRKAAPTAKRAKARAKAPARKVAARKPAAKAKKPARKGRR